MLPRKGLATMGGICKGKMEEEADNLFVFFFSSSMEDICIKDLSQCILLVFISKGSKDLSSLQTCRA